MPLPSKPSSSPPASATVRQPAGTGREAAFRPAAVDGAGPLGGGGGGSVLVLVGSTGTVGLGAAVGDGEPKTVGAELTVAVGVGGGDGAEHAPAIKPTHSARPAPRAADSRAQGDHGRYSKCW